DGFEKSSNSRRTNFAIMRRTYRTLNGCEMQYNAEVGLFTKPSILNREPPPGGRPYGPEAERLDQSISLP
ncbi:MAG: hypothetical protein KJO34_02295, partial [Deltaproteobacteria bacterium]|nr:hypothetical protein [Deltaproteobacteria bacterium]